MMDANWQLLFGFGSKEMSDQNAFHLLCTIFYIS